ncbi:crotonase/enoyl-CoA hydratase family protein [Paraburkholderia saeva]|uniref:Short-chain-enoyl-CoA hydratase n=1 Tax=Paraburkholderia saeva TaxID=2777537 RepID=A0A9N8RYL1_9BURK|nr:crotonase/enoyl-CoA hydratase family protein [Paraburkholderia saeva]CAG4889804.1 Short-chain-enoyl-CoA hydratase [Paraburkholderia saeva]CAG4897257.1 Short-chain-enoyl-CoA hydratase [Paraburkholderia saeva]CAG4913209.1 Short-chain-enoyl-CoA hydratase [Paraburkholderia saeva]
MNTFLKYEQDGHIVTLTMNEPERRNPLTGNTAVEEFLTAIARIEADRQVRAVILTGAGSAFSSGGNIRDMERHASGSMPGMEVRQDYRRGIQQLPLALFNLEVPVIAAVNGAAIGAGLDLACMCDIRIASESAKFAESFVKLGIIPGDGGAWLLPRIIGMSRAAELTFTGQMIDAQQALAWNLVSRIVSPDALLATAQDLARSIAANPPHAVRLAKRLLREGMHCRLDTLLEMSAAYQTLSHQTADHREAVAAFIEKRPPSFNG